MARPVLRSLALAVLALTTLDAHPLRAQAGGRMRVLVPDFRTSGGTRSKEGERVAQQLRRQISALNTHAAIGPDDGRIKAALRRFELKAAQLDCVQWQQLASTTQAAQLVLCGTIDSGRVTAKFSPAGGGDPFEVPAFGWESAQHAALQIVQSFGTYIDQLRLAVSCDDHVRSEAWTEALDRCTRAAELNPASSHAHYARGTALRELDRPDEALAAFEKVLELDAVNQSAMLAAGLLAARLNRRDIAQSYFKQYLEFDPDNEAVRLQVARDLATAGDPAGALVLMEQWTGKPQATALAHQYAGFFAINAAVATKQLVPSGTETVDARELFMKAIAFFERVIALQPDSVDASVYRQLMHAYREIDELPKALEIAATATQRGEDAQTWSLYAQLLQDAKQYEEALRALERAAGLDATLTGLNARRGVVLLELGRLNDAAAALRTAQENAEVPPGTLETIAQQITVRGWGHATANRHDQAIAHYHAARQIGRSDRSVGMANFFHGATLFQQAEALLRTARTAAPAVQAKPLLEQARILLEGATGFTDQEVKRVELLASIKQFNEVADALIRARR